MRSEQFVARVFNRICSTCFQPNFLWINKHIYFSSNYNSGNEIHRKCLSNFATTVEIWDKFEIWSWNIILTTLRKFHVYPTGSPKKHENWKTTRGLFIDVLEKRKGHSIKLNKRKLVWFFLNFFKSCNRRLVYLKSHQGRCPVFFKGSRSRSNLWEMGEYRANLWAKRRMQGGEKILKDFLKEWAF